MTTPAIKKIQQAQLYSEVLQCRDKGRFSDGITLITQWLTNTPNDALAHAILSHFYLQEEDEAKAQGHLKMALKLNANNSLVQCYFARWLLTQKKIDLALNAAQKAYLTAPTDPEYLSVYSAALRASGAPEKALPLLNQLLDIQPNHAEGLTNLGLIVYAEGKPLQAIPYFEKAITIKPFLHPVIKLLGAIYRDLGDTDKSYQLFEGYLRYKPKCPDVLAELGEISAKQKRWVSAIKWFTQAHQSAPSHPAYLADLCNAMIKGRHEPKKILPLIQQLSQLTPHSEQPFLLMAILHKELGQREKSLHHSLMSLDKAENEQTCLFAAELLKDLGRHNEAIDYFERTLRYTKRSAVISSLLFCASYLGNTKKCAEWIKTFGQKLSEQALRETQQLALPSLKKQKSTILRLGLVSGDLHSHPVGFFLESFIPYVSLEKIELFAYSTQDYSDNLTDRIKPFFKQWSSLNGFSAIRGAEKIRQDGIDILIDLSGHTGGNRLDIFAFKAAPIQISWLGYFATTGVEQMDYILGDPYVTPYTEAKHFVEKIWQLPETYLCFSPPHEADPIQPPPSLDNGYITFGCFNNLAKVNDAVKKVWAKILRATPKSRLMLKSKQLADKAVANRVINTFSSYGISSDRLILEGHSPRNELLRAYHRVDIALDPFPYPGGTTSAEALWMGVPVITMKGNNFLSHVGESIAHNTYQSDWIAKDEEEYINKATSFASDTTYLANLRMQMRKQVAASPLFDAPRFARHFQQALLDIFHSATH